MLETGDMIVFRGDQRHSYHNPDGGSRAVAISVVCFSGRTDQFLNGDLQCHSSLAQDGQGRVGGTRFGLPKSVEFPRIVALSKQSKFRAPDGTKDILPDQIGLWHRVEDAIRKVTAQFAYEELRTPVFEYTSLFQKATGETSDIVEKEMYRFEAGEHSYSLRPEFTPSVVRAFIQHSLNKQKNFWKLYYVGSACLQ